MEETNGIPPLMGVFPFVKTTVLPTLFPKVALHYLDYSTPIDTNKVNGMSIKQLYKRVYFYI